MTITRRTLQIGLGLLWLLDGALQLQPFMFGRAFGRTELATAGAGQPGIVSHPVHWAAQIVIAHPALTNSGFAAIQVALGLGLLWRPSVRSALVASIGWGTAVWFLGEGLGGLATGETLLTGAPGAALLYALIAFFAFPDRHGRSSVAPSRWAVPAWSGLWVMGAGLQLAAGNNSGRSFSSMFSDAGSEAGGWIGSLDAHLSHLHIANGVVAGFIALEVLIAMWSFVPGAVQKVSLVVGSTVALATWLLVQGLGDLTTGQATDPNSGPLIVLLGLAAFGAASAWQQSAEFTGTRPALLKHEAFA
jgi:hypothetical protein